MIKKYSQLIAMLLLLLSLVFWKETINFVYKTLFIVNPPLTIKSIRIDNKGIIINEPFVVKTQCTYRLSIRLRHKQNIFNEYKKILQDKQDYPKFRIDIYTENDKNKPFFHFVDTPKVFGKSTTDTSLKFDLVRLNKGEYIMEVEILNEAENFKNIEVDFTLGTRPKSRC